MGQCVRSTEQSTWHLASMHDHHYYDHDFCDHLMTDLGTDHRQTLTKMTLRKLKEAVFYILGESLCLDA